MSTDGALLATTIVIDHQRELDTIPFIVEPELKKSESNDQEVLLVNNKKVKKEEENSKEEMKENKEGN